MASSAMFSVLKTEVELLNLYPFLSKVAVDNEMPVPGYLFHEINALTYADDGSNCKPLMEYLVKRLQSESPIVKIKVLKMILHLTKNGHKKVPEEVKFHEMILKQTAGISLPVDSSHPKLYYDNIRKLSQEILQTAFSEASAGEEYRKHYYGQGIKKMSGYGSQSDANRSKMIGFGSTSNAPKSIGDQFATGFSSFVGQLITPKDKEKDFYKHQEAVLKESVAQYIPITIKMPVGQETVPIPPSQSMPSMKQSILLSSASSSCASSSDAKIKYRPGRPGGGWDDSDEEDDDDFVRKDFSSLAKESTCQSECSDSVGSKEETLNLEYVEEEKLVDGFAVDLPLTKITPEEVQEIRDKCSKLNGDKVIEICFQRIAATNVKEVVMMRSLYLLEVLLLHGEINPESLDRIASQKILDLSESEAVPKPVRTKAKKIGLMNQYLLKQLESLSKSKRPH